MWELKAIEIGSKKLDAQVNIQKNNVEIEIPYYKNFKDTDTIKIDNKSYTISYAKNLGDRDEIIVILTNTENNNEHKSSKVGKDTTL
jgi:SPP1 family predicted phage head-tail adaptor